MGKSAFIYLVKASVNQHISLEDVKDYFYHYKDITAKTGEQLGWEYSAAAFPYEMKERSDAEGSWFYLKAHEDRYEHIIIGVGTENHEQHGERHYIQIVLPDGSTQGDYGKATEFAKYLAKKVQGELHLFNGRVMYYYKRK